MNYTDYNIETPKSIELFSITMDRKGYGQYYVNVDFEKDGEHQNKSIPTNDSMLYDEFYSDEQSWYENPAQTAFDLFLDTI